MNDDNATPENHHTSGLVATAPDPTSDRAWERSFPVSFQRASWRAFNQSAVVAEDWRDAGFSVEEARAWSDCGFSLDLAARWKPWGVDPTDAAACGWVDQVPTAEWALWPATPTSPPPPPGGFGGSPPPTSTTGGPSPVSPPTLTRTATASPAPGSRPAPADAQGE